MTNKQETEELSLLELFKSEVASQLTILNAGLESLESQPQSPQVLESLIRSVTLIYNTAQLVEVNSFLELTHVMVECLNTTEEQKLALATNQIAILRQGFDWLSQLTQVAGIDLEQWLLEHQLAISLSTQAITAIFSAELPAVTQPPVQTKKEPQTEPKATSTTVETPRIPDSPLIVNQVVSPITPTPENTVTTPIAPTPVVQEKAVTMDASMLDLFRLEVEEQARVLNQGLLDLESQPSSGKVLESLMRAAHSVKGSARIVSLDAAVNLAHVMEDCFVAAQKNIITLGAEHVDVLLQGVDILVSLSELQPSELNTWLTDNRPKVEATRQEISQLLTPGFTPQPKSPSSAVTPEATTGQSSLTVQSPQSSTVATIPSGQSQQIVKPDSAKITNVETSGKVPAQSAANQGDRVVRVNAENLNRIMGLAGESLIESNWLQPFADSLIILKKRQMELSKVLQECQESIAIGHHLEAKGYLDTAKTKESECRDILSERLGELELFARRTANLSDRLYREVIASNMRPFADGVQGFPRMIRDLSRKLGKQVKFEILGKSTPVDRDILQKLEAPLTHILRNSVDHGLETPEERLAADKPVEGTIRLMAAHRGGMLSISITDDGRGINYDRLREKIVSKSLVTAEIAEQLTESEMIEFLFLPGFSTAKQVSEISGRGVGLDIARSMAQEVGGSVRATSQTGKGINFNFQLPLTLSVVRTLLVEIASDPYAFPLARVEQVLMLNPDNIYSIENRQYFTMDNKNIGLISAHQVLDLPESQQKYQDVPVVVIGEQSDYYGLVVDRFIGEYDLVVRPLDPRLGKVQDISASAIMGDGSPILIVDISDLVRSVDNLLNSNQLNRVDHKDNGVAASVDNRKSVLVVDDSITVREMERKLLENKGYKVDVAVDGMEGWYTVCSNHYDLVVSDVDMPRMNGIELVNKIKNHAKLKTTPIIIVSYKDREEDRMSGLEAGADYYLTKASFHDDTFIGAVMDLIGK
jgi:two-component system sensor histidine kinase and response regulator WspE